MVIINGILARRTLTPRIIKAEQITSAKIASAKELDAMRDEIKADAEAAVNYALEAAYPPTNEVDQHVFAP